jgi:hypothetical protein
MLNKTSFENRAVRDMTWKNYAQPDRSQTAI